MQIPQTLVILSGLLGSGKTTMSKMLVDALQIPILAIDDVVDAIPQHMHQSSMHFWHDMVYILLKLVDGQLSWGHSVLVDSVFMGTDDNHSLHQWSDRHRAFQIARKQQVRFRPIYLFISDENLSRQRLAQRAQAFPDEPVATWSQVDYQRKFFQPWQTGQALFVDSAKSPDENFAKILNFITSDDVQLTGWD